MADKYDHLAKLKRLLDEGAISEAEFRVEKERILAGEEPELRGGLRDDYESPAAAMFEDDPHRDAVGSDHADPYRPPESEAEPRPVSDHRPWGMEENTFCMLMHLSQFSGVIIPFGGLIMPLIMWLTEKDKSVHVDQHGRVVMNWVVSSFIYAIVSLVLAFFIIGIFLLLALVICGLIFTILGAVRANDGRLWHYPMAINFFGARRVLAEEVELV